MNGNVTFLVSHGTTLGTPLIPVQRVNRTVGSVRSHRERETGQPSDFSYWVSSPRSEIHPNNKTRIFVGNVLFVDIRCF